MNMTLIDIVEQLKKCGFTCEVGRLEDNVAFQELEKLAEFTYDEEDKIAWDNIITGDIIDEDPMESDNITLQSDAD